MSATISRRVVRDPVEMIFEDGSRYATEREITMCDDWRKCEFEMNGTAVVMNINFGWARIGPAYPVTGEGFRKGPFWESPASPKTRRFPWFTVRK